MPDAVKNPLDVAQLLVTAFVGKVTGQHHGIDIGGIDFGNRFTQLALIGIAWRDMHIAQDSQSDHPTLRCQR